MPNARKRCVSRWAIASVVSTIWNWPSPLPGAYSAETVDDVHSTPTIAGRKQQRGQQRKTESNDGPTLVHSAKLRSLTQYSAVF